MASLNVLIFDAEGWAVDFDVWLDDLQLFLQCDSKDGLSLFNLTSRVSTAPTADADSTVRSQWLTRDAAARLAVRNHLPSTERAHFSQYKSARALYDAVVARYSSPAIAALSRLMLPYLFSDLAAFATYADLVAHLRTRDARYRAALPTEDHFLSLCPTELIVDLLEERLAAAEKSVLAVGASRGDRRTPFFEGCSPVPLLPSVASAAAVNLVGTEEVGAASAPSGRRRPGKGKGSKGGGGGGGGSGGGGGGGGGGGPGGGVVSGGGGGRGGGGGGGVNVPIFDLDFHAILAAMYAHADIIEGDGYMRVPPDPGTVAAALGASASAAPGAWAAAALGASASTAPGAGTSPPSGTTPTASFHTFTLDSGASRSFFRDSTTLMPLSRPVAVSLADPSGGPVLAHSSTVLPCPAAPSGLLSGLHLPSFSTNLVSGADLQDAWVDQFTPGGQRVTHCTCSRTGRHLATFTRRPRSSLYTLTTAPPPTLIWHHRLGHPSLPRLRGMASRALVSGLPRSLPPLPPGPAPTCVPCVEGRQRAAPHSSFPPTEAPLQTLHMDVWGPARVRGQGHERYFLLVVDDYSHRGGEFSSDLLRAFCRLEGIRQTFTLPASPQQNGIAERRIGMVMDVARTSKIYAAAPHFLWPFAVQYAAHQINLQPRVSLPKTTPTLRWTGKVGDAYAFRVWGSRAFVRDTTADKLSSRAVPCVFLGFPLHAPGWQFYHPTSRRVLSSQDVTFDESVSYYSLFPHRAASPPPPPLFLAPDPAEPVEVAVDSGAGRGAETGCAEPDGVAPEGTVSGGAEPSRAASGGALGVPSRREPLSPQRLREWYSRRCRVAAGASAAGAGADGVAGGAAGVTGGAGTTGGTAGAGIAGGAAGATGGAGAAGGAAGANGGASAGTAGGATGTGDPGAEGTGSVSAVSGGAARPRPYFVPLLQQVLGSLPSPVPPPPPFLSPSPVQSQSQLQPASPLPGPSPYSGPTRGLTERREPESCPASPESRPASPVRPVCAGRVSRPRLPPVPGTHSMTLRPSTAPQCVPLHSPPASSFPDGPDQESDSLRAASPVGVRA
ncbi:unnamed protein product [Closterium sp. NIES-53]